MTAEPIRCGGVATLFGVAVLPGLELRRTAAHDGVIHGTIHDVEIRSFAFLPADLPVRVGDGVRWTNTDLAPHTATAEDGSWTTGPVAQRDSVTVEVKTGMSLAYVCDFHPEMRARLVLLAT